MVGIVTPPASPATVGAIGSSEVVSPALGRVAAAGSPAGRRAAERPGIASPTAAGAPTAALRSVPSPIAEEAATASASVVELAVSGAATTATAAGVGSEKRLRSVIGGSPRERVVVGFGRLGRHAGWGSSTPAGAEVDDRYPVLYTTPATVTTPVRDIREISFRLLKTGRLGHRVIDFDDRSPPKDRWQVQGSRGARRWDGGVSEFVARRSRSAQPRWGGGAGAGAERW